MDYCFCPVCKKNEERIRKGRIDLLFLFILTVFFLASPFAVQGISGNSSFYAVYPTCTVNNTNIINCSETSIKINCYVPHFQFVQFVTYNLNSTTYLASQLPNPNQNNWTLSTTLSQKYEQANFVYNFSSAVITDTSNIIAVYPQNITINQSCTDCFPNIVNINSSCGNNDLKNVTYMDLQNCTYPIPPNTTASCNFCDSNWQCTNYSVCSASTKYKYCYAVSDLAGCFGQTNLPSDNFTGQFDDYTSLCNYLDFKTNTTLMSSFQANLVVSEYPYVETNTTINLEIFVSLAGNPFQISNVQMQIANTSFVFNYDPSSQTYKKSIILNEVGDYPFVITGRENTTTAFRIDGLFYSRRFVTLGVELFEDRNQSTRYKNNFAEVIALKNDNIKSQLGEDLLVQAEKLKKLNMIILKTVKLNQSTYFSYDLKRRAFHSPYVNGVATLRIPVEEESDWELRLLNMQRTDEYIFDNYNFAKVMTLDSTKSNDILLANGKILKNATIKILVSPWDYAFWDSFTKWAIIIGVILIFVGAMVITYIATQDWSIVIRLLIALIGVVPTLYILLNWIF